MFLFFFLSRARLSFFFLLLLRFYFFACCCLFVHLFYFWVIFILFMYVVVVLWDSPVFVWFVVFVFPLFFCITCFIIVWHIRRSDKYFSLGKQLCFCSFFTVVIIYLSREKDRHFAELFQYVNIEKFKVFKRKKFWKLK